MISRQSRYVHCCMHVLLHVWVSAFGACVNEGKRLAKCSHHRSWHHLSCPHCLIISPLALLCVYVCYLPMPMHAAVGVMLVEDGVRGRETDGQVTGADTSTKGIAGLEQLECMPSCRRSHPHTAPSSGAPQCCLSCCRGRERRGHGWRRSNGIQEAISTKPDTASLAVSNFALALC